MKDELFEFMTQMYSDLTKRLDVIESGQNELKTGHQQMAKRLDKIEIALEHDINKSLQSLHEGVSENTTQLKEHSERLTAIENKVDYIAMAVTSQDKRLKVVEKAKA